MMKNYLLMALSCIAFSASIPIAKAAENIVAVVNKGVITSSDVKARMDLISSSSGLKPSKDLEKKLRPQVIDMLIDEQIRSQEATRIGLKVDQKEIDGGFEQIARQNNIPADVFKKAMEQRGIRVSTLQDQIKAQLSWTKVIQSRIRPKIQVTDNDIDSELQRLSSKIGKDQFKVAEIFIPVTDSRKMTEAKTFANQLSNQLQSDPTAFTKAARQFSQSPGATQGKFIGWVMQGSLPKEVDDMIPTMSKGKVSTPIETSTGLYIILLEDKRQLGTDGLPSRDDILERIGMQRMDRAQRKYYKDLRSSAFIEKRG